MSGSWDDETLMDALREAVAAREAVPRSFTEAGKNAYAWRNIEAELAQLAYDSRRDLELSAPVRSESASIGAFTFHSARFSVEVEITDEALLGQLLPPHRGTVEAQLLSGHSTAATVDDAGSFAVEPRPDSPFRLRFRTEGNPDVLTNWLTVLLAGGTPLRPPA